MRIYKISYIEYVFQKTQDDSTLAAAMQSKFVAAGDALEAVDALRVQVKARIEISAIERMCQVDVISKGKVSAALG